MRLTRGPASRQGASREAAQLQPGAMHSLDVSLVAPGAWQVVCRTANHYADGMTAIIDVAPNGAPPALAVALAPPTMTCWQRRDKMWRSLTRCGNLRFDCAISVPVC